MAELIYDKDGRLLFTKEMKKDYTILIPMMAPIHFTLIQKVFAHEGYNVELLTNAGDEVVQQGLKYVHNDTCYPALLVIGQMIDALNSGKYDLNKTALIITQTGGGCRASNYIHLLRKALHKAGYDQIPVISLNLSGLEKNSGFKLTLPIIRKAIAALVYGDTLMQVANQTRPYEIETGATNRLLERWIDVLSEQFNQNHGMGLKDMKENLHAILADFAALPLNKIPRVKVGVVGEIYVKYSALANNNLEDFLAQQGCEVMVPGIMGFMLFKVDNRLEDIKLYGGSKAKYQVINALMKFFLRMERAMIDAFHEYPQFVAPFAYENTKKMVDGVIGYGSKMGEGWLLTAEMIELVHQGYENVVCTQPFGCLPNHICGKGMIRKIKALNENANIVAIDYDPGATKVNQENRIKLMLAVAREALEERQNGLPADTSTPLAKNMPAANETSKHKQPAMQA